RRAILPGPHELCLIRKRQPLGQNKLARLFELFVEFVHKRDVCLEVLFRPGKDSLVSVVSAACLHGVHHQDIFHVIAPLCSCQSVTALSSTRRTREPIVEARYADLAARLAVRRTQSAYWSAPLSVRVLRNSSRYCVSSLWSLHVNDPVAQAR